MSIPRKIRIIAVVAVLAGVGLLAWHLLGARQDGALTLYGNVDIRQVDLGFRVGGRIAAVLVDEGDAVVEGQPLARLDDDLLRQQQDQLDMLTSGYREEDVLAQRAAVAAAAAELNHAEIQVRDAVLTAPQKGIILTRAREAGAIVQAGQTVYTLTLTNPVWLRAYVDEPNLGKVKPGMPVSVAVDAAPGKSFPGTVGFISPTAEFTPKTVETREVRTALVYRLRIQAEDPENVMRQGMPVTITLEPVTP